MIEKKYEKFDEVKINLLMQKKALEEIKILLEEINTSNKEENKRIIQEHLKTLEEVFKKSGLRNLNVFEIMIVPTPLKTILIKKEDVPKKEIIKEKEILSEKKFLHPKFSMKHMNITEIERQTIRRLKKRERIKIEEKKEKPSKYIEISNKLFFKKSKKLAENELFKPLEREIIRANFDFVLPSYISVLLFTVALSMAFSVIIFLFFMIFELSASQPFILLSSENIISRFIKTFWIMIVIPASTFLFMYYYPSLEKKSIESRINQELPFATIHMAAISGSMIEPSKIFSIIISTKEYVYIEREFKKVINEINIQGYDLVTALKHSSFNCPSKKLSELMNGISSTITSGGDLPNFFDKRAQTLLFEYGLERNKQTKSAETFMDLYISIVIAAPMILMLLLMMIKISGLGLSISSTMISVIMILGVSVINIAFMAFLHLKQPKG